MKPVMKLKREVIKRIRDLAKDCLDASIADRPQSLDLGKDEGIGERMIEYLRDPERIQLKAQLKKMINDLPKDERIEFKALVELGKDAAVTVKDWDKLLNYAREKDGDITADYLVGTGALAYYIDKGLAKMKAGMN